MQSMIREIPDLAKEAGKEEIDGCDVKEWPGKVVTFKGVESNGLVNPFKEIVIFFPDDRVCTVARKTRHNGWELLTNCAEDWTRDDIMDCVRNDATLSDAEVEAEADEICAALEIAND